MNLDLNDVQTEALIRELSNIVQNDRYPLSPRIVTLREILGQLRAEPERQPLPPDGITSRRAGGGIGDAVKAIAKFRMDLSQ